MFSSKKETTNTQLSSQVEYAPNNVGFIVCSSEKFTYFANSEQGKEKHFGLTLEETKKCFKAFFDNMCTQYNDKNGFDAIKLLMEEIDNIMEEEQKKYSDEKKIMSRFFGGDFDEKRQVIMKLSHCLQDSGHIPILLSEINDAEVFKLATRAIDVFKIAWYFENVNHAAVSQALEYAAKHNMMTAVKKLHDTLFNNRYEVANDEDSALLFLYNTIIYHLENDVIKSNQKSLPAFVEFDLCSTFVEKVHRFVEAMPHEAFTTEEGIAVDLSTLRVKLFNIYKGYRQHSASNPYEQQSQYCQQLYGALQEYVKALGLPEDMDSAPDDFEGLSIAMEANLKYLLPLIQYLNASDNPFARNGLFGQLFKIPLHSKAKKYYERHESRMPCYSGPDDLTYQSRPLLVFNEDQIDQLLYGSEEVDKMMEKLSGLGGKVKSFFGLLTSGDTDEYLIPKNFAERQQQQSNQLLALPQPEKYQLRLTYNSDNKPEKQ
ncbi:MAG: hypothetical protein ACX932_01825 [Gammaproteobacteria bacterium]